VDERWSRKHAHTQRRLCERFAAPVIDAVACSARDRLIVLLMARAGLRCGLRRDVHLLPDSAALGCQVPRAHLHVVRRDNPNGAWAKCRPPAGGPAVHPDPRRLRAAVSPLG